MLWWAKFIAISGCMQPKGSKSDMTGSEVTSPDFGPLQQKLSCVPILTPLATVSLQLPQQRDQAVAFSGRLDVDSGDSDSVLSTQLAELLQPQRPHLEIEDSLQDVWPCILRP